MSYVGKVCELFLPRTSCSHSVISTRSHFLTSLHYFFRLSLSLPPFRQCYMTSTAFKGTQCFVLCSYCSHDERRRVMTIKCCSELSRAVLTMPPGTYTSLQVELTFHSCNKFPVFTTSRTKSRCTLLLLYILHKFSQLPPIYSVEHPSPSPVPPLLSTTT
jgi:hypothetical protein